MWRTTLFSCVNCVIKFFGHRLPAKSAKRPVYKVFCNYNTFLLISNHSIILFAKTCPSRKIGIFIHFNEIFFNILQHIYHIYPKTSNMIQKTCQVRKNIYSYKLIDFLFLDKPFLNKLAIFIKHFTLYK